MLSNKDIAIQENIANQKVIESFFNHVYIRKADDAIVADSLEDFMDQINDPCHIWQGSKSWQGYGYFTMYTSSGVKTSVKAHRFAYALAHGFDALPKGRTGGESELLVLNHICHNRLCVKLSHLEVITKGYNSSLQRKRKTNV